MQEWMMNLLQNYGYMSLFILMILENLFPPIPSEFILTFAGFLTSLTDLHVLGVLAVGTLGAYLGALILYFIGKQMSPTRLEKWLESSLAKKLHFQKKEIDKAQKWFFKHGIKAVLLGRMVPVIRSLISIPAGMMQMSFVTFSLYTLSGTFIWNMILVFLGRFLGQQWTLILDYMKKYNFIWLIVLGGICLYWFVKKKMTK